MKLLKTAILIAITCVATQVFAGTHISIAPSPATKTDRFDEFKQSALAGSGAIEAYILTS